MYVKSQDAENLMEDPHVNVSGTASQKYESINAGLELTQESVDTEIIEDSNIDSEEGIQNLDPGECEIIDELDFRELEQISHVTVKLTEGQEFMLEKEIEFQEMEESIVELPDKQEINRQLIVLSKMPVKTSCEQYECVEMKTCDISLPKLFTVEESVHTDEIELKMPKINAVGKKGLPREVKLEMPLEQTKSNLHTKWKKVLESKIIRRENPIKLVRREICRPPPKPHYILDANGK